jgi:hypothetical protein
MARGTSLPHSSRLSLHHHTSVNQIIVDDRSVTGTVGAA